MIYNMSMGWQEENSFIDWSMMHDDRHMAIYISRFALMTFINWVNKTTGQEMRPSDFNSPALLRRFFNDHENNAIALAYGNWVREEWISCNA